MWGDPEPTPGEVDADLGYKTRWKNSCYPSLSWTAQPQAARPAPAAEGKVKVWKEVAALGDRGIKQPQGICCLLHLSQFPSSQEQQAHLRGLLIPVGSLLQHFWIFFLTFKISWQTPGMEVALRRAKLDWERSEDPGITAQNVSHTLHALRVFLQLLVLLPGTRRPATPASAWNGSPSQLVWVIPFMLDTPPSLSWQLLLTCATKHALIHTLCCVT